MPARNSETLSIWCSAASVDTVRAAMEVLREAELIETGHGAVSFVK